MRLKKLFVPATLATVITLAGGIVGVGIVVAQGPSEEALIHAAASAAGAKGHEEQRLALSDGVISAREYRAALTDLTGCLTDAGLTHTPPLRSPIDGLTYEFEVVPSGPNDASALQSCNARYWDPISTLYTSFRPQVMAEPLRVASIECLRDAGFAMSGDERNYPELIGNPDADGGEQREAATECVFQEARRLYPGLRTFTAFG